MTAVAARTRCGWVKFRECGDLLHVRRFPLMLKGAVYGHYVRPGILYCALEKVKSEFYVGQRDPR